jgi:hypothetical protein
MKNKSNLLLLLLGIATIIAVIGMMRRFNTKEVEPDSSMQAAINQKKISMYDTFLPMMIHDDYAIIDSNVKLIDSNSIIYPLKTLAKSKYNLIVRYSGYDCNDCVDQVFELLSEYTKKNQIDDVIFITDSQSQKEYVQRLRDRKSTFSVYNIQNAKLGLTIERRNYPLFFILTPEFRAIKIYIPIAQTPLDTEDYLTETFDFLKKANIK